MANNQRLQVDSGINPQPLRPVAAPIDTYDPNAGNAAASKLGQLAHGLSQLAPEMAQYADQKAVEDQTTQQAAGVKQARMMAENGKSYAQAVKDGAIPLHANPFFVAGFREQFGRVTADKMQGDMTIAMLQNPQLQTTTKIEDFDKFRQDFQAKWTQDNVDPEQRDAYFEKGYGYRADAITEQLRNRMAEEIGGRFEKQSDEAWFAEVNHGAGQLGTGDPTELAATITEHARVMIAQGRNPTQVNQTMAKAIAAAAQKDWKNGSNILKLMDQVKLGSGALSETSYGSKIQQDAQDQVSQAVQQGHVQERQAAADLKQKTTDDIMSQAVQMLNDPHADVKPLALKLASINPEAAATLSTLQGAMTSLTTKTDEKVNTRLYAGIYDGSTSNEGVVKEMTRGNLTVPDANFLIQKLKDYNDLKGTDTKGVFTYMPFRNALSDIAGKFNDPLTGAIKADYAQAAAYAHAQLIDQWQNYMLGKGATATDGEKIKELSDMSDRILARSPSTISVTAATKPDFTAEKLPTTYMLSDDDLRAYAAADKSGARSLKVSPHAAEVAKHFGVETPEALQRFMLSQLRLRAAKTTQ